MKLLDWAIQTFCLWCVTDMAISSLPPDAPSSHLHMFFFFGTAVIGVVTYSE